MKTKLTVKQRILVRLLETYPQAYIFLGGDAGWYLRYSPNHPTPLKMDGRVVHSLQRTKIINGHARPFTMADGDRVWTLNRTHPALLS